MSGIVAIWNLDGAPVDPVLVESLTRSLELAGPDAQETWVDGAVGLGHAMFRTTFEARDERQPMTLDQRTWIVADARIDARTDLLSKLRGQGIEASLSAPDAELILHAYGAWGEKCIEHLLGDFSFVIWDAERRRIFCARDHLGVKQFFYALLGRTLVISNSLFCVQRHPSVSKTLNDLAIADFLLFEFNYDLSTTAFRDIKRLAPAHVLRISGDEVRAERYWRLPVDEPLFYRDRGQYVEQFRELLNVAIRERIRCDWVGVYMSGGLDSSGLAVLAQRVIREQGRGGVHAFTFVYNRLIPDDERMYAGLVAESGGFPVDFEELDKTDEVPETGERTPEPVAVPWVVAAELPISRRLAACGRVFFYGEGPDNALYYEWPPYVRHLASTGRWPRLVSDVVYTMIAHRCLLWFPTLPGIFKARRHLAASRPHFPEWLNPQFVMRCQLKERWLEIESRGKHRHPLRPIGFGSFETPLWADLFSRFDSAHTGILTDTRHPYVDLRILRFLLAVPALPWSRNKYLIRRAFQGILPGRIVKRPKVPLRGHPEWERSRRAGIRLPALEARALSEYTQISRVPMEVGTPAELAMNLRPLALNWWLRGLEA